MNQCQNQSQHQTTRIRIKKKKEVFSVTEKAKEFLKNFKRRSFLTVFAIIHFYTIIFMQWPLSFPFKLLFSGGGGKLV